MRQKEDIYKSRNSFILLNYGVDINGAISTKVEILLYYLTHHPLCCTFHLQK